MSSLPIYVWGVALAVCGSGFGSDDRPARIGVGSSSDVPPATPVASGGACDEDGDCVDTDVCTVDTCDAKGACQHELIWVILCDTSADCPEDGPCDDGLCLCVERPTLCLEAQPPASASGRYCGLNNELVEVRVEMGYVSEAVCGAQFYLQYDRAALQFVDMDPGGGVFDTQLIEMVNPAMGTIAYSVGSNPAPPQASTHGPATLAVIRFRPIAGCSSYGVRFIVPHTPPHVVKTVSGLALTPMGLGATETPCNTAPLTLSTGLPTFNCPFSNDSVEVAYPDCGEITHHAEWPFIRAMDTCEGTLPEQCQVLLYQTCQTGTDCPGGGSCGQTVPGFCDVGHSIGLAWLDGGDFPSGRTVVNCTASNGCGLSTRCGFEIQNTGLNLVAIDVALAPTIVPGSVTDPLTRCVDFTFDLGCPQGLCETYTTRDEVVFGLPNRSPGRGLAIVGVPAGYPFRCVTAKDPHHTLGASCCMECVDSLVTLGDAPGQILNLHRVYYADFSAPAVLDPVCHALIGGDLSDDNVVDIIDFVILVLAGQLDPSSPCDAPLHADINGDGLASSLDFSFVLVHFLGEGTDDCQVSAPCGGTTASPARRAHAPRTSVTLRELAALGLGKAGEAADRNDDGIVDLTDLAQWANGDRDGQSP